MRWIRQEVSNGCGPFKKAMACWQRITSRVPRAVRPLGMGAAPPGDQDDKSRMTRGSRPDLWGPGGAIPPGYPATPRIPATAGSVM